MSEKGLITFSEAARELGVFPTTIGDLAKALGITPKPMTNGRAKGLNEADMKALRRALRCDRRNTATLAAS